VSVCESIDREGLSLARFVGGEVCSDEDEEEEPEFVIEEEIARRDPLEDSLRLLFVFGVGTDPFLPADGRLRRGD